MPWEVADVDKHIGGLTDAQKKRWVSIANSVLKECVAEGATDCDAKAIKIASAKCKGRESIASILTEFAAESFSQESFTAEAAKVDMENGTLYDALIFGPKQRVGPYFKGSSGLYSENFFTSLAGAVEGAWSWPYHPRTNEAGQYQPRDPKEAIAKWSNARQIAKEGLPEVRGTWKLRKKAITDYDLVLESPRSFAFSIFVPTVKKHDPEFGMIHDAVNTESQWRPSVDLVEAGGANRNAIESAQTAPVAGDVNPKEEQDMTKEEVQALIDQAVRESDQKAEEKFRGELAKLNRKNLVAEKLQAAKLDREHVTEALAQYLETCAEDKIVTAIQQRAKEIADAKEAVKGAGHSREANTDFTREMAVEVVGSRGITGLVREMAGENAGPDPDKSRAFSTKWAEKIGRRICNFKDKSDETRQLRAMVAESYAFTGVRNLFAQFYGKFPNSLSDLDVLPMYNDTRLMNVAEASIASTGFSTLNNTVLASIVIEAHNSVGGLVADQLMTAYPTNKETENIPGFNEPTGIDVYAEDAAKPDAAITNKYVSLQKLSKIGGRVFLTREAVFYDRTGELLDRASRIGQQIALHREHVLLRGIADVPSYTPVATPVTTFSYYPSGNRSSLWTATNTRESNALTDYTDLENAVSTLLKQVDSRSERLVDNANTPLELLVPGDVWVTAEKIRRAELLETNAAGSPNMRMGNMWSNIRVFPSQVLNNINATTWYCAGAGGFAKQFIRKITFPLEVVPLPAAEVTAVTNDRVAGVACMFAERCFARDNVRVVKNVTGTLSS